MKVPREFAIGTIRFSVGRRTTPQEIDKAIEEISKVVSRLEPKAEVIVTETKPEEIKLTHYTHGLGCACKLRPQVLEAVLAEMPAPIDRNVLVGIDTADDAAVYRIDDTTAIVQTVDFFTPIVDDPYHFGAIAAANSLSDIYAMGGRPLFALAVVGFPSSRLPVEVLQRILEGASAKADEAGIAIVGGHTVDDTEPKFGLAVSGIIDPNRIVTNRGAKPGDVLILTKPIGTGILATALKRGLLDSETEERLVRVMSTLNGSAAEAMQQVGVNACTDITGFGLLGHLYEMVCASGISAQINASEVRLLPKVVELAAGGIVPGGTLNNIEYTKPHVSYQGVAQTIQIVLNDAQTSGGLLIAVPEERAGDLLDALKANHVDEATIVGRILDKGEHPIEVLG
ncbi:MAG TPA: selenide, water dikinase SelD [Firmicutes bacterium]|nr:selenide, water dikinase SelD [Bacillota bacterium]